MTTRIDTHWQYRGLQVVRLENDLLRIDVLPELGAKIWNLVYKPADRNLLWHNPHIPPARQPFGAAYDDTWCGGWDELVPNDVPVPAPNGEMIPDHGEVWAQEHEWEVTENTDGRVAVRFVSYGRVLPTRFERTLSLKAGEPCLRIRYRLANLGVEPVDFQWNVHPALAISPATRVDLPARRGYVDSWNNPTFDPDAGYEWPYATDRAGRRFDMRTLPNEGPLADLHYLPDVPEGWYAVTDTHAQVGFGLVFPTDVFPHLWLFRTLRGWRNLYTLIVEASNSLSTDMAASRQADRCGHLQPGEVLEAEVTAVAYAGVSAVRRIEPDGRVVPGEAE